VEHFVRQEKKGSLEKPERIELGTEKKLKPGRNKKYKRPVVMSFLNGFFKRGRCKEVGR